MPCPTLPHLRSYEGADGFNKAHSAGQAGRGAGGGGGRGGGREAGQAGVVVEWGEGVGGLL